MDCLNVRARLGEYVDGEVGAMHAADLARHLDECDACRADLARLQAVVEAVETWPLVAEPAGLSGRVMARIRPRVSLPRFRLRWSDLAASLSVAIVTYACVLAWRYLGGVESFSLGRAEAALWFHMLWLDLRLAASRLAGTGDEVMSLSLLGGLAACALLALEWSVWRRGYSRA